MSLQVLGIFVRCSDPAAKIHYEITYGGVFLSNLTESSPYASYSSPYISVNTPFGEISARTVVLQAVYTDPITGAKTRSKKYTMDYRIEGAARPNSYFFLVPGLETKGTEIKNNKNSLYF
jgi:hypothetical protein